MRRAVPGLCLLLVAPTLSSCALFGGSDLDDALDLVPDDAVQVSFRDRQDIAERLEVDDVEPGASTDDLVRYATAVAGDSTGTDDLLTEFVQPMQDAAMSELDVRWSVTASTPDGTFTAYKVDGDVDLDQLADDLADSGYTEDEVAGRRHLLLTGAPDDLSPTYPSNWVEVTVDPGEDLLVVGQAAPVLRLVDDEAKSAADTDRFDDLLDGIDDVQYLYLAAPPQCGGTRGTPEEAAAVEASGVDALGSPDATAYVVSGDDGATAARLEFADDDAAEADLEARRAFVSEGRLAATAEPVSGLGTIDLGRDGAVVRADLDLAEPRTGLEVARRQDGFVACRPSPDETAPDETTPDETTPDETTPDETTPAPTAPSATVTGDAE